MAGMRVDGAIPAFGGVPYGASKRVSGVPKWMWVTHAGCATGTFAGAPYGATAYVRGVPTWVGWAHAGCATGTFGRASLGPRNV
eukprot:5306935-Pyramimonas_sp.AAC.1